MSIKSSVHYLAELSGLSKSTSIFNHLKSISGLSGAKNKIDCLAEITNQPKGKEQVWYYRIWAGLTGSESIQYCLSVLASFTPPQLSSVIQWIDNKWTAVWNFDRTNYIEVPTPQTITSEYQCIWKGKLRLTNPIETVERLYSSSLCNLEVRSDGRIGIGANGPSFLGQDTIEFNMDVIVELCLKEDSCKLIVAGNETVRSGLSFITDTTTSYRTGDTGSPFSGLLFEFSDCQETWTAPSLTGSQGTIAVATDPNGTINDIEYSPDKLDNGNYALKKVSTGDVNLNPTSNATLTAKGNLNEFITPEELNDKHDLIGLNPIATRSIPSELNPTNANGVIIVWDGLAEELTSDEKEKTNKHMGML